MRLKSSGLSLWTNVYGSARSILALGTLLTLLFNSADSLFRPLGQGNQFLAQYVVPVKISLFSLLSGEMLNTAKWLAVCTLVVTCSGWRPRVMGILHWYVSYSFAVSAVAIDGGDQVTAIVTLLLIPITLTDSRRSHWAQAEEGAPSVGQDVRVLIAKASWIMIRLQAAVIYCVAAVSKVSVPEWLNGTALYYWFTHPVFGANDWVMLLMTPIVLNSITVTLITWGVLLWELILAAAIVSRRSFQAALLPLAVAFHFAIFLVHGLASFFFAMSGLLVLYFRAPDEPFEFLNKLHAWVRKRTRMRRGEPTLTMSTD